MSGKLVHEVMAGAPRGLTPRARLVLVAIAEHANDQTRTGWPGQELLADWVECSPFRVRQLIAELIASGALRKCSDGRPGHRAVYLIPPMPKRKPQSFPLEPQHLCRECGKPVARRGRRGPWPTRCADCRGETETSELRFRPNQTETRVVTQTETRVVSKPKPQEFPPPLRTLKEPSSLSLAAVLADRLSEVPETERENLARRFIEKNAPRNSRAYLRMLPEADLRAELESMRAELAVSNGHAPRSTAEQLGEPPCEHGMPGGTSPIAATGQPRCALCRHEQAAKP